MKIEKEDYAKTPLSQNSNNRSKTGFENYLHQAFQSQTGDAYYQIHQSQFETCSLHFNPLPPGKHEIIGLKPMQTELRKTPVDNPQKSIRKRVDSMAFENNPKEAFATNTVKTKQAANNIVLRNKENPIYTRQEKVPKPMPDKDIATVRSAAVYSSNLPEPVSNHRLFVDNQEVELSLQHSGNYKEKQSTIQLIKKILQEKGLHLKQLLINGEHA